MQTQAQLLFSQGEGLFHGPSRAACSLFSDVTKNDARLDLLLCLCQWPVCVFVSPAVCVSIGSKVVQSGTSMAPSSICCRLVALSVLVIDGLEELHLVPPVLNPGLQVIAQLQGFKGHKVVR